MKLAQIWGFSPFQGDREVLCSEWVHGCMEFPWESSSPFPATVCLWEIPVLAAGEDLHQCHPTGLVSQLLTFPSWAGRQSPGLIHTCLPGKEGMSPCFSLCFLLPVTVGQLPCQPGAPAIPGTAASSPSSLSLTQFHRVAAIPELRALSLRGRSSLWGFVHTDSLFILILLPPRVCCLTCRRGMQLRKSSCTLTAPRG